MSALKKLQTGVPGLDILTHGGIPEGRSTLIAGKSGTGKTVVGLQIASNLARQGSADDHRRGRGVARATCRTAAIRSASAPRASVRQGALHFADVTRPMDGPTLVSGEYDLSGLTHRLEALVKQTGARACIIDSATALFSPRPPADALRSHFFQLVYGLRRLGAHGGHPRRSARATTAS